MLSHNDIYDTYRQQCKPDYQGRLYGLIDHASLPGLANYLIREQISWVSLLGGEKEANLLAAAPLLFQIETDQRHSRYDKLLDWISKNGTYTSSIILLASPLPMQDLALRLQARLDATLPENMDVLLRFYDPRIFEQLISSFASDQKSFFLGVAACWWFVDRRGKLHAVPAEFAEIDELAIPILITVEQESALIDASEPDQVDNLLRSNVTDAYARVPLPLRYDFILRHSEAAKSIGVSATHELALYCSLPLLYGEKFAVQDEWNSALQEVKAGKISLQEAIQKN